MAGFPGLGRSCTGGQQRSDLDPPMDHAVGHANGLGGCHQPEIPITGPIFLVVHVGRERSSIKSFQRKPCVVWNQPRLTKQKLHVWERQISKDHRKQRKTKAMAQNAKQTAEIARRERGRSADRRGISQDLYLAVMTCLESRDKSNATSKSHLLGPFDKHWLSPSKLNVPQLHD